jgi:predicted peptidase
LSFGLHAAETTPATQPTTKPATKRPAFVDEYLPLVYTDAAGKTLNYRLFVPPAARQANNTEKFPLVLYLHGSGGCGDNNIGQLTDGGYNGAQLFVSAEVQKSHPSFVLAPQCPKKQVWGGINFAEKKFTPGVAPSEPLRLTLALLAKLTKDYPVDTTRQYITGLSLGGFGTWQAITEAPDTFAAAIPICGGAPVTSAPALAQTKIPIWAFHGGKDTTVPTDFSRHIVKALKDLSADITYTEYPSAGHNSWSAAYAEKELVTWLFSKQKKPTK